MKKAFLLISTLIKISLQCSLAPNFQKASLEEQIDYAGIILIGNVVKIEGEGINDFNNKVHLENVDYYRGCGSKNVIVAGFKGGHLCGNGVPKVSSKIIVFACENLSANYLKLNDFLTFTGFVEADSTNVFKLQDVLGKFSAGKCRCARKAERCLKRSDNLCFVKKVIVDKEKDNYAKNQNKPAGYDFKGENKPKFKPQFNFNNKYKYEPVSSYKPTKYVNNFKKPFEVKKNSDSIYKPKNLDSIYKPKIANKPFEYKPFNSTFKPQKFESSKYFQNTKNGKFNFKKAF